MLDRLKNLLTNLKATETVASNAAVSTSARLQKDEINAVDLAFVVDTTGSMSGLIDAAKRQMVTMLEELVKAADIRLRLAVVDYRDHPPQETSYVYKARPFTEDLEEGRKQIQSLSLGGGGDLPEAVLDGVNAACLELTWRKHARRLVILVGDAPPHGVGAGGDGFPKGCPCGETVESVTRTAEEVGVTVHALGMTPLVAQSFGKLARFTGGQFFEVGQGEAAIKRLGEVLKAEFSDLDLDRKVLAAWHTNPDEPAETLAERLGTTRRKIENAQVRLLSRDLIAMPILDNTEDRTVVKA